MAEARMVTLTDDNFEQEVLEDPGPVLVDFWASWCGPCRMVAPLVEEVARDYAGRLKVGKLNVDENGATPGRYNVLSIPTLLLFKNGQPAGSLIGYQPKEHLVRLVEEAL